MQKIFHIFLISIIIFFITFFIFYEKCHEEKVSKFTFT